MGMAELAFVGDGPKSYQVWLGGSPVLTRTAWPFKAKMKNVDLEITMEPILMMFKEQKQEFEAFGDFCHRVGAEALEEYSEHYECSTDDDSASPASATTASKKATPKATLKTATTAQPKKAKTAVVA